MNVGLYSGAVSMQTQAKRLDTIAENLASLSLTGYKRFQEAFESYEIQGPGGRTLKGQRTLRLVDFSQGNLNRTGRDLDLALAGDGFFAVESPDGERYTRNGEFRTTSDGVLVNARGWPVAWETRSGLLDPTGEGVTVDETGSVRQGQTDLGRLRVVDFEDKQALVRGDAGTWIAPEGLAEATATATVQQGALEESNATAVVEMVEMIETQRHFDTLARTLSGIQEIEQRLTRSR